MRKACEKVPNSTPRPPPRGGEPKCRRSPRSLLQRGRSPSQGRNCESLMSRTSNTRGVQDPRALRPLRGDRRIPFGFRHVPLEAASVESSGVQWSTANHVELTLNFNKSRLCKKSSKKYASRPPKPSKITAGGLQNRAGRPPGWHFLSPAL